MTWTLDDHRLGYDGTTLLDGVGAGFALESDPTGAGVFLVATAEESQSRLVFGLGSVPLLQRFTACHRYEPYWMKPVAGDSLEQVPSETQFFLARLTTGTDSQAGSAWLVLVPLFGELFRFSLRAALGGFSPSGRKANALELLGETGDPFTPGCGGLALFAAVSADPYELCERGAASVAARLGVGRLRRDKPLPDLCDGLGWCTWDAFYQEVSMEKVRDGLASFRAGGVQPSWLVLDDGWQSQKRMATGERRLTSFVANEKFPGGLGPTVRMAKEEFSVRRFLVWHTMVGYWGGTDAASFPAYEVHERVRRFGEGILEHRPTFNEQWWGALVGLPAKEHAGRFFDDYHRALVAEGVDGVKVDSQAVLEGLAAGEGGRIPLTLAYREALERSAERHFDSRLINCMSNGQETWYAGQTSTLLRSSIDFFPRFPESHGAHLYANAQVGLWFGQFMHPDWDMFQSGHEWGAFHAAGRAISGGPVYVSDKPGVHDFSLLRKLVCSDGTVLRCDQPGVPTVDVLCHDPTCEDVLLEIRNRAGQARLVGLFHCRYQEPPAPPLAKAVVAPSVGFDQADEVVCFLHGAGTLQRLSPEGVRIVLAQGQFELATLVRVEEGFAPIGLSDKFASAAAIVHFERAAGGRFLVELRDGGAFVAYCRTRPSVITRDDEPVPFVHDAQTGRLDVALEPGRPLLLEVRA